MGKTAAPALKNLVTRNIGRGERDERAMIEWRVASSRGRKKNHYQV